MICDVLQVVWMLYCFGVCSRTVAIDLYFIGFSMDNVDYGSL